MTLLKTFFNTKHHMKKTIFYLSLFLTIFLLANKSTAQNKNNFKLEGIIKNGFNDYIYIEYGGKRDSCLVKDGHFSFKGFIKKNVVYASFDLKLMPSNVFGIYLEKSNMNIALNVQEKKTNDGNKLYFFTTESISGSITSDIDLEYNNYFKTHVKDADFREKIYLKSKNIILKYPSNPISGSILSGITRNWGINKDSLKMLYAKIDKKAINPTTKKFIEQELFPENLIKVNDPFFDFKLPTPKGNLFNTKSLHGKWFLIDFWASWCSPCREQLPYLIKIYEENKNKNFEIISVSIDEKQTNWINAIKKEKIPWVNVIENKGFVGEIVKRYKVNGVPTNFLINPEGVIVFKDIDLLELEKLLKSL